MTMLTAAELTQLRADVAELMPDTCDIERNSSSVDSAGFESESWAVQVDDTPCRIDPYNKQFSSGIVGEREENITWWQLTVSWNVDIADGDRVIFGSDTYQIVQLHDDHSNRIVRRALLAKI